MSLHSPPDCVFQVHSDSPTARDLDAAQDLVGKPFAITIKNGARHEGTVQKCERRLGRKHRRAVQWRVWLTDRFTVEEIKLDLLEIKYGGD